MQTKAYRCKQKWDAKYLCHFLIVLQVLDCAILKRNIGWTDVAIPWNFKLLPRTEMQVAEVLPI